MTFILQNIVDAISLGALYALTALGIGLIFGIMRLINFAHGELIMLGAYALFFTFGMHEAIMGLVAMALVIVAAIVMERVAFRPLRRANPATLLIASFALAYFLQHLVLLIFGARPKSVTFLHELSEYFVVEGLRIPKLQVVTIAITIVLLVGLVLFFRRSSIGTQMRAAAEDFGMARPRGRAGQLRHRDRLSSQRGARRDHFVALRGADGNAHAADGREPGSRRLRRHRHRRHGQPGRGGRRRSRGRRSDSGVAGGPYGRAQALSRWPSYSRF